MKYSPQRNFLYPVLRPFSDDYPNVTIETRLHQPRMLEQEVALSLEFIVAERRIRGQVEEGDARCVAMLYCRATMHRQMLRAPLAGFRIDQSIHRDLLSGDVEVHPAIVAVEAILHPTDTAHPEYNATPSSIEQWQPLAIDLPWRFSIDLQVRPTKAIFNLVTDDNIPNGRCNINLDVNDRYISILCHPEMLPYIRNADRRALETIYLGALVNALAEIQKIEDQDEIRTDGWVKSISLNLARENIQIGKDGETGTTQLFEAAQQLLGHPFTSFTEKSSEEQWSTGP